MCLHFFETNKARLQPPRDRSITMRLCQLITKGRAWGRGGLTKRGRVLLTTLKPLTLPFVSKENFWVHTVFLSQ